MDNLDQCRCRSLQKQYDDYQQNQPGAQGCPVPCFWQQWYQQPCYGGQGYYLQYTTVASAAQGCQTACAGSDSAHQQSASAIQSPAPICYHYLMRANGLDEDPRCCKCQDFTQQTVSDKGVGDNSPVHVMPGKDTYPIDEQLEQDVMHASTTHIITGANVSKKSLASQKTRAHHEIPASTTNVASRNVSKKSIPSQHKRDLIRHLNDSDFTDNASKKSVVNKETNSTHPENTTRSILCVPENSTKSTQALPNGAFSQTVEERDAAVSTTSMTAMKDVLTPSGDAGMADNGQDSDSCACSDDDSGSDERIEINISRPSCKKNASRVSTNIGKLRKCSSENKRQRIEIDIQRDKGNNCKKCKNLDNATQTASTKNTSAKKSFQSIMSFGRKKTSIAE